MNFPNLPTVSLVVPAYDQPELLREALRSALEQEGAAFDEIVVTDDLGAPETAAVVASFGCSLIRYVKNEYRLGAVENWNRALSLARMDWVTVLHEDDLLYPWFLRSVLPRLRREVVAVGVSCERGARPSGLPRHAHREGVRRYRPGYYLKSAITPFPGVVISRAVVQRLGGFDPHWGPLADYEFWYRLSLEGTVETLRRVAAFYRVRDDQWTTKIWPRMVRLTHLLRLRIAREQFPEWPSGARWVARFFSARNAAWYEGRFGEGELTVGRVYSLSSGWGSALPSGWIWLFLKILVWAHEFRSLGQKHRREPAPLPPSGRRNLEGSHVV